MSERVIEAIPRNWGTISLSIRMRAKAIHSDQEKTKETWAERLIRAREISKMEPWGLALRRFPNKDYALLGYYEARRKRSGGPWSVNCEGKTLISSCLEELFLQVVERKGRGRVNTNHAIKEHGFPHVKDAPKRPHSEGGLDESITHIPGTSWGYLPSEMFYGAKGGRA
jgi:hypothetical protein